MAKKRFDFICDGFTQSGAKFGPITMTGSGETKEEAKRDAKKKCTKIHKVVKFTRCDPK